MKNIFPPLTPAIQNEIGNLIKCIDKTFPIPKRFYTQLPKNISQLSLLLTKESSLRNDGYMGESAMLQAYLRYFLPWNVFRLCRLNLKELLPAFKDDDVIIDLGSGPFTFVIALWITHSELRTKSLKFYCVDHNKSALLAGKKLFASLAGGNPAWRITTIHAAIGKPLRVPHAALVTALNVSNEFIRHIPVQDSQALSKAASRYADFLLSLAKEDGNIFTAEPGVPRAAQFLNMLRGFFIQKNCRLVSPCTGCIICPMSGGIRGTKWCHFSFDTDDAPSSLQDISAAAGLLKDKAVLSFLFCVKSKQGIAQHTIQNIAQKNLLRIMSDIITLPREISSSGYGRYACSEKGLCLVSGGKETLDQLKWGALIETPPATLQPPKPTRHDPKTGALIVEV
ncbi:hypothetical protein AGMMS50212_11820 [Spirochaetia bacterium]|nr:hypothetical protein AGMMS50212_11820 [Spirochaetia bacterium]